MIWQSFKLSLLVVSVATLVVAKYRSRLRVVARQAQILALILTGVSIAAVYLTNKLGGGEAQGW